MKTGIWQVLLAYKHEIIVGLRWLLGFFIYSIVAGAIPMPAAEAPHWKKIGFAILNGSAGNLLRAWYGVRDTLLAALKIFRGVSDHKEG